jgi:hypothetical protein
MFSKAKKKNMRSVSKTLKQKIKTKTKKSECSEQREKKKKLTSGHMGNLFWFGRPCGHP